MQRVFGAACLGELFVGKWSVALAEVHSLIDELRAATARTYRLVVDLDVGVLLVVVLCPLGHKRVGERSARTVDSEVGSNARVLERHALSLGVPGELAQ